MNFPDRRESYKKLPFKSGHLENLNINSQLIKLGKKGDSVVEAI